MTYSAADRWCLGWKIPPHVPADGPSVLTNIGGRRGLRLCRDCWRRWNAEDAEEVDW